jgi:ferredoxin-NADP reductase/Na+-translocating ferredoxin:NAD+ oxidoreductase RnfD subunit
MLKRIDATIDGVTMYRLTLYVLLGILGVAVALGAFGLLPFSPLSMLLSAAFLVAICWAMNTLLAKFLGVPTNGESTLITALILALIIDPAQSLDGYQFLGWAAILAMSSKYILSIKNKHIFNPAVIAVVITSFALGESASWWIATAVMVPATLVGSLLIVRKIRQEEMVAWFVVAALVVTCAVSVLMGLSIPKELQQLVVASPLFFVAGIMLTEPLTAPPTRNLKRIYALLTGVLFVPQIHIGALYSTPELALAVGNVFSWLVSPKQRVTLTLKRKARLAPSVVDFFFAPSQRLTFKPGQYIECTLAHPNADARGVRRYFTIASSPTEESIQLGVRFYKRSSTFKTALYGLGGRTKLLAGQVAGDFTLPGDTSRKLVFIAGGIGVTPFRSMLKYLLDTNQRRDIVLLYANKNANDFVYQDVLSEAQRRLGVRTVYTMTDQRAIPANWQGARGRIDAQMIQTAAPDYRERTFYLSGPPEMVNEHERTLRALGVSRSQIRKDYFNGLV